MSSKLLVTCKLCNGNMRDIRMLACFHSFCLQCLEASSIATNSSKCPTCQIKFEMPQGGLRDLKRCEIVSKHKTNPYQCDSCKQNIAASYCVECSYNYCSSCLDYHGRIPISSNHKLESVRSSKGNVCKYSTCNEHSEAKTLFCVECQVIMCGRCLTVNHCSHKIQHVTDYFNSVKSALQLNIDINEDLLNKVSSNYKSSSFMISSVEITTSLLNKEIDQRKEELKMLVDSFTSDLLKDVDARLKQHQKDGREVLNELKSMETDLNSKINGLKEELKNLNFENATQATLQITDSKKEVPKYSNSFNCCLQFDRQHQVLNLGRIFGNLGLGDLLLVKESTFRTNFCNFALHEGRVFVSHKNKSLIHEFECSESMVRKKTYSTAEGFQIHSLLVIGSTLFAAGVTILGRCRIIKVSVALGGSKSTITYDCGAKEEKGIKLSKSADGNILVSYGCCLANLREDGKNLRIYNNIKLLWPVDAALQLRNRFNVVIRSNRVCLINDCGSKVGEYLKNDESLALAQPSCMVKDRNDNIYVYDRASCHIFILDCNLCYKASYKLGRRVHEMLYDEQNDRLLVLSECTILEFKL